MLSAIKSITVESFAFQPIVIDLNINNENQIDNKYLIIRNKEGV